MKSTALKKMPRSPGELRARLRAVIELHQSGLLDEAIAGYRAVLAVDARQFDALRLLGAAHLARGEEREAVEVLRSALTIRGDFAEAWSLFADAHARLTQHLQAAQAYERALALQPDRPATWNNLGLQRHRLGELASALACFEQSSRLCPDLAEAWSNRGAVLAELQRYEEALASYTRALELQPNSLGVLCNLGRVLHYLRRSPEALEAFERARAIDATYVDAWSGMAAALADLGRPQEALSAFDRALFLRGNADRSDTANGDPSADPWPLDAKIHFHRGLAQLTLGNFGPGWEGYEWRHRTREGHVPLLPDCPEWQAGESLSGLTLALVCEQGFGDTIQFCRYIPRIAAAGAHVVLLAPPALLPLLSTLEGAAQVLPSNGPAPKADRQCRLLSVGQRLQITAGSMACPIPYLAPDNAALQSWRTRLGSTERMRVGIACSGNPTHNNDRNRSIPLESFRALQSPGIEWHLLQKDLRPADEAALRGLDVQDHRSHLNDFSETAALIRCMDAVVSVDTSIAHLAGALGAPLLLLLPLGADWRWMTDRQDSPWYPTAQLLRQQSWGDWTSVLTKLGCQLEHMLVNRKAGIVDSPPSGQQFDT